MRLIYTLTTLCFISFIVAYNLVNESTSLYALLIFWILFTALIISLISTIYKSKRQ